MLLSSLPQLCEVLSQHCGGEGFEVERSMLLRRCMFPLHCSVFPTWRFECFTVSFTKTAQDCTSGCLLFKTLKTDSLHYHQEQQGICRVSVLITEESWEKTERLLLSAKKVLFGLCSENGIRSSIAKTASKSRCSQ